jgi:alpha-galactosidase
MDQAVTADPVGSVQVRRRMKMYKALLGPRAAVYGDHVELTQISGSGDNEQDLGSDFASTLGTGGVLGTKCTWPDYGPKLKNVYLNSEKEPHWKKWIELYNQKMLSKGTFLDLYVYGYDVPEGYAIDKDGNMFYAFYADNKDGKPAQAGKPSQAGRPSKTDKPSQAGRPAKESNTGEWRGDVELRGLQARQYRVVDYVNDKDYGTVTGPNARLHAEFNNSLLLQATPVGNGPVGK